jgi:four helix bundle protein
MPNKTGAQVVGRQLLQSGTSVGAQYREACRAKSNADFISKVEGCLQELEETAYWLEILVDAAILGSPAVAAIEGEARELNAIFTTIARRVKAKQS